MSDIVLSRIDEVRPCVFKGFIRIGDAGRDLPAFDIDFSNSRCRKKGFFAAVFSLPPFDFDCHPDVVQLPGSGSFLFDPEPGISLLDMVPGIAPIADLIKYRRITCKLTLKEQREEDADNCVILVYRLAVWDQSAANPTPIIDLILDAGLDSAILGKAQATLGGGTPPDLEKFIFVRVCCVKRELLEMEPSESVEEAAGDSEPTVGEGVVTTVPKGSGDGECFIRCIVLFTA